MRLGWACDVPCAPAPLSSQDIVFNVYCASHPSIEDSKRLTFRPFNVAYPHLSAHFASAGLDPLTNTWDTVHDYNAEDPGAEDNFRVEVPDVLTYQELPLDGLGPCENPVLGPSGERYAPAAMDGFEQDDQFQGNFDGAQNEGDFGGFGEEAEAGFGQEEGFGQEGDADAGMEAQGGDAIAHGDATDNGFDDGAAHEETNGPVAVPPAQATFAPAPPDFMRELEAQERERKLQHIEEEKKQREAIRAQGKEWLQRFQNERTATLEARKKANREQMATEERMNEQLQEGDNFWEGVTTMVAKQNPTSVNGVDVSRMKGLLVTAKTVNIPVQ